MAAQDTSTVPYVLYVCVCLCLCMCWCVSCMCVCACARVRAWCVRACVCVTWFQHSVADNVLFCELAAEPISTFSSSSSQSVRVLSNITKTASLAELIPFYTTRG